MGRLQSFYVVVPFLLVAFDYVHSLQYKGLMGI